MSKPDWTALADRYGAQEAAYNAAQDDAIAEAFEDAWAEICSEQLARGEYLPAVDLLTLSRAHQDAGAAQDGQASIALALGTWLAVVVAFAALALCVYGAAWINGVWLAPFAGLAR